MSGLYYAGDGDVLNSGEFIVAHGCNTHGVMGSGIAKQVRNEYREVYAAYSGACGRGEFLLGTAQRCPVPPVCLYAPNDKPQIDRMRAKVIYNLGTQKAPGKDATPKGIFLSFVNLIGSMAAHDEHRVAIPRIGAGIGGLDWNTDVVPSIVEALDFWHDVDMDVVVYDFTP